MPATLHSSTANLLIGASDAGAEFPFWGSMYDLRVFSDAKSAADIEAIYEGGLNTTNLLAWYPLQEESGDTAYDVSSNADHCTWNDKTYAEDTGVAYSYPNTYGYRDDADEIIPARVGGSVAADGNALTYTPE
jgi:hypothetical protein